MPPRPHEDAQPLGGAVDGRRQPGRPRADYHHVEGVLVRDPCGAPAARAISAFDGSWRTRPSGSTISGELRVGARADEQLAPLLPNRPGRSCAGRSTARRPPSARRLDPTTSRRRYERSAGRDRDRVPTRAGNSRRLRGTPRQVTRPGWERSSRCPREPGVRIASASAVVGSPQTSGGTRSARFACGWSCRARGRAGRCPSSAGEGCAP